MKKQSQFLSTGQISKNSETICTLRLYSSVFYNPFCKNKANLFDFIQDKLYSYEVIKLFLSYGETKPIFYS